MKRVNQQRALRRRHRKRSALPSLQLQFLLAVTLAFFVSILWYANRGTSASITGAPQKLDVRGGVVAISPGGSGDSTLELGNAGRDVASTGDIYLRPERTTAGSKFKKNAGDGTVELTLTGDLTVDGTITIGGVPKAAWPTGDPYWNLNGSILSPSTVGNGLSVQQGMNLYGNDLSNPTLLAANPGGVVAGVNFLWMTVHGNLSVTDDIKTAGGNGAFYPGQLASVYARDNDGTGSGLDADNFEGTDMTFILCEETSSWCNYGPGIQVKKLCRVRHDLGGTWPELFCVNLENLFCNLGDGTCPY